MEWFLRLINLPHPFPRGHMFHSWQLEWTASSGTKGSEREKGEWGNELTHSPFPCSIRQHVVPHVQFSIIGHWNKEERWVGRERGVRERK